MGVQARAQCIGMATARSLDSIVCFSMDPPEAQQQFAADIAEQTGVDVTLAGSVQEVVESVDILALATTAATPIVDG